LPVPISEIHYDTSGGYGGFEMMKETPCMKVLQAKVVENRKEDPGTEPDHRSDTWLIEAKLEQNVFGWQSTRIDLQASEVGAEIIETSMADAKQFTVRTRGKPSVDKGDRLHVAVRDAQL
jgi:hypothetical protein